MGKRARKEDMDSPKKSDSDVQLKRVIIVDEKAVDSSLALLFASSSGPVQAPPKSRYEQPTPKRRAAGSDDEVSEAKNAESSEEEDGDEEELSSVEGDLSDVDIEDLSGNEEESDDEPDLDKIIEAVTKNPERKRKRKAEEEDLEGKYMEKLAKEDEKEEAERITERRLKRQRMMAAQDPDMSEESEDLDEDMEDQAPENEDDDDDDDDDEIEDDEDEDESEAEEGKPTRVTPSDVPLHESLVLDKDALELEKASRTVFLANVSTDAISSKSAKKTLLTHLSSFLDSLPPPLDNKLAHKLESLRFRSTAYAAIAIPKKAAFAKKDLMSTTTKSTNAYVVYSTAFAAREAVKKLNGTTVLDRHLRVDGVAHPAKTDHKRCVFVGNLGFVDDESQLEQGGENERKRSRIPSDVEEGLWRQFGKAGTVESVRVVRDEKTRVGKGFAYVQFEDANAVEAALLFDSKKFPPMLPRPLRVMRAKPMRKLPSSKPTIARNQNPKSKIYNPKPDPHQSSLSGRASKLLGRAGAAKFKKSTGANEIKIGKRGEGKGLEGVVARTPESIVFEGFRASSKAGKPRDLKVGGGAGGKKKGKPRTRSAKRAGDWKKGGGTKRK